MHNTEAFVSLFIFSVVYIGRTLIYQTYSRYMKRDGGYNNKKKEKPL